MASEIPLNLSTRCYPPQQPSFQLMRLHAVTCSHMQSHAVTRSHMR